MDHLGAHGCQMLVDFGTGLAMDGIDNNPEVYQLPVNPKKHYMYDILYHLTRGHTRSEGHAQVNVVAEAGPLFAQPVLQFRPLDFYTAEQTCSSSSFTSSPLKHDRQELLRKLFESGRDVAQMGNSANKNVAGTSASTSVTGNGVLAKPDSSGRGSGAEQPQVKCERQVNGSSLGFRPDISFQPHCGPQCSDGAKGLQQLQPMLQGALPTEEIVKAMLDKITAEEKLNVKVQYLLEKPNVERSKKVPKSKAASKNVDKKVVATKGYMMDPSSPATSPSKGSWDPILDSPDRRQLEDFLTEQEKTDLRNLVLSRKNMASHDVNQPEELMPGKDQRLRQVNH